MFFAATRVLRVSVAVAGLAAATGIHALEPSTPLGRFGRQAWTMENGLPQNTVSNLLQSRDGFLWAGTELGLARLDGVSLRLFDHATAAAFPDAEIRCLLDEAGNGGLWVGTGDGLVRWKDGIPALLTTQNGLPSNSIRGLAQTTGGTVWAWTEAGLARWTGDAFQLATPESGLPQAEITSIAADAAGGLWVGTTLGAAVFRAGHWLPGPATPALASLVKAAANGDVLVAQGSGVFLAHHGVLSAVLSEAVLPAEGVSFLDRLSSGAIAVAGNRSVVLSQGVEANAKILGRWSVGKDLPGSRIESLFADREGCLWVGTNRGLARIAPSDGVAAVQLFPPSDPLASNAILSLLEDREGDLWVGTETAGLQILRDTRFRTIGASDGLSSDAATAIVEDARQTLWIGTRDAGLNRVRRGPGGLLAIAGLTSANGLLSNVILSLAAAPDGDLWVGTPDGLNRIGRGGVASYTSADGLADDFIRSVLVAPDNSVWIGTRRGLTHLDHGRFQTLTQSDGLGSDLVGALARTPNGDLWIATLNGLSRLRQGRLKNFTTADGLSSNVITALDAAPDGRVWIGTQSGGLNLWDGNRFLALPPSAAARNAGPSGGPGGLLPGSLPAVIHAITSDDRGHLWLATATGLTRADAAGLAECAAHGVCNPAATHAVNFTIADGLRSRETSNNSHPTVCRAADATLWFTTPRGVIVVDPLHFPPTLPPPPVVLERFAVDDRETDHETVRDSDTARIPAGAMRFEFDYAGLSFAAPQQLRYQYTLEGFDRGWTDAGSRRTAYYTNIPPGNYRFRVRAALGDAAFAESAAGSAIAPDVASYAPREASLGFELLPHFYQTAWFRALAALAVAALILLVFRRRVLRVEREFRAVMGERNRIAREIHDTLAQGYVGISLQLEILGELLRHRRTETAEKHLALTQELVREGLKDARQSIWALRSQDAGEQTLPIRLRRLVEKAGDRALTADLAVHGACRALAPDTEREILRIAQEAIQNVKKHAAASRLSVRLDYENSALTLTIADDGKGFAPSAGASTENGAHPATRHFGLTGMRERAALIHAEFEISSQPGSGATVQLKVSAPEAQ